MSGMATILIVEDEFAIAELLEMVLVDEGYSVLRASNGRQGLERLANDSRPDLVISDYMMPILDGASMIQTMRGNEAQRDIPYIIMSSMPEDNVRQRIQGYASFVRKPFHLLKVVELVATILGPISSTHSA
ncbi:response regulator [Rhodopila sp.]|uniref:response regulator n=1 Tax=Rhodopila sp. TaxID=2480087 RepID=UPI003D0BE2CA